MRVLFWIFTLFALAIAAALFATHNQAVVTLFWPGRFALDVALNLVVLVLVALLVFTYVLARTFSVLNWRSWQQRKQAKRLWQQERDLHTLVLDAFSHYMAGRYARSRKFAQQALDMDSWAEVARARTPHALPAQIQHQAQLRALLHYLLAESSHAVKDDAARNTHIQQAVEAAPAHSEIQEGLQLRAIRWALHDNKPADALERINALPQGARRRIATLRLRLKTAQLLGQSDMALETARTLIRHGAFSADAGSLLLQRLLVNHMHSLQELESLHKLWQEFTADERSSPVLALAAAQRHHDLGGAHQQTREWLLPLWDACFEHNTQTLTPSQQEQLAQLIGQGVEDAHEDDEWLQRIEAAYQRHSSHSALQYLMGMACMQRKLWGKAQQVLSQFTQRDDAPAQLRHAAWRALAALAEQRGDDAAALHAWKQAANE